MPREHEIASRKFDWAQRAKRRRQMCALQMALVSKSDMHTCAARLRGKETQPSGPHAQAAILGGSQRSARAARLSNEHPVTHPVAFINEPGCWQPCSVLSGVTDLR